MLRRRNLTSVIGIASCALYAYWQLVRVREGHLFALALPWDRPPSSVEVIDARISAEQHLITAVIAVCVIGIATAFILSRSDWSRSRAPRLSTICLLLFVAAVAADLFTTLRFFHASGIDHEFHPGVRLFGYAYGRTMGPLLAKLVQAAGIILFASFMPRAGNGLLIVVAFVYGAGALYNCAWY